MLTVREEMKYRGDSEILNGLVHYTTRICSCFSVFRVVSRTNSCSISDIFLLKVRKFQNLEPVHTTVLAHESLAQMSLNHEKTVLNIV